MSNGPRSIPCAPPERLPGELGAGPGRAREAETGKRTPAIALTAYGIVEERARALSAGFDAFVAKPIDPDELIDTILSLADSDATGLLLSDSEM